MRVAAVLGESPRMHARRRRGARQRLVLKSGRSGRAGGEPHTDARIEAGQIKETTTSNKSPTDNMTVISIQTHNNAPAIGINGFGRIGRALFRICIAREDVDLVAVNHTATSMEALMNAIKHDSTHGPNLLAREISVAPKDHPGQLKATANNPEPSALLFRGRLIHLFSHRDATKLNWAAAGAEYVMESTGQMTTVATAYVHIAKGNAKKVIISAPSKDAKNIVYGVNHREYHNEDVISNASCTTNCLAPIASVLSQTFGVESGMMTTIHASTSSQRVLDGFSSKDIRAGRSAMGNIIPASTGAAKAVVRVLPELAGKFQGMSVRVPVSNVSLVDLTVKTTRPFGTKEGLMDAFRAAAHTPVSSGGLHGVLSVSDDKLVSSDYLTSSESSIIDADACVVLDDCTAKVIAWYDNEFGFSNRMVDLAIYIHTHPEGGPVKPLLEGIAKANGFANSYSNGILNGIPNGFETRPPSPTSN